MAILQTDAVRDDDSGDGKGAPRPFNVTNRMVFAIAAPMTLAYLTTPLQGLTDTAVVGRLGSAALIGGLAVGAVVFDLVYATFNFLRSSTTGLVAQAMGRDDPAGEQAVFWRSIGIGAVSGLLIMLAAPLLMTAAIWFMAPGPEVRGAMETYVGIRILSAPFGLSNYSILGYLLGRGEALPGLLLQALINGINIVLSILLGLTLGWGIEGVAWATVAGEIVGTLAGFAFIVLRFDKAHRPTLARIRDRAAIMRLMALNRDIMIRSFVLVGSFAIFTQQGAQFGALTLAANAVLMNFFMVAGYYLDGFANAAEQIVGRAVGARYRPAFDRGVKLSIIWGFVLAALTSLFFLLFGESLIALMTTAQDVRAEAARFMPWAALTAIAGVLAFEMDGVFIGATWSRDMRNMMLLSMALFLALVWFVVPPFGNHGLWASLNVFLAARGFSLLAITKRRADAEFG